MIYNSWSCALFTVMSLSVTISSSLLLCVTTFYGYSHNTHSCPDVTDDRGRTPLDSASEEATNTRYPEGMRKRYTETAEYLKSLSTELSELLLYHS